MPNPKVARLTIAATLICCQVAAISVAEEEDQDASGTLEKSAQAKRDIVAIELAANPASIRVGGSARLSVHFTIQEGWHIYAQEPGEAGLPTTIAWSASRPANVVFEPIVWPTPKRFVDPGDIKTFGYTGTVVLSSDMRFIDWTTPSTASGVPFDGPVPGAILTHAKVNWLACKELCVPGSAQLDLSLPVSYAP